MTKPQKFKLNNGLRIILVPQAESLTTTVMVSVAAGSEYETKEINGISHFLEHMCFKGTKKRPNPIDIPKELDGLGAQYNAFTSQECTSYYAKCKNENAKEVLDIIVDMYQNPIFDEKEIEKERGVIIQEINMYEDTPTRKIGELFYELVYGDQPAGWNIAGKKETVQKLNKGDFIKYREKYYIPNSTVITISGKMANQKMLELVKKYFAHLKPAPKNKKPKTIEKQTKPKEVVLYKNVDQSHLILGFRTFNVFDKRKYALYLAADILCGGMSSRLFQKIRNELGAAYYISTHTDLYLDHGLLLLSAGVDTEKIEIVIKKSLEEFGKMVNEKVNEDELKRAKEHSVGNLFMSLESSDALAFYYSEAEILNLPTKTPNELANLIKKVTPSDIQKTMKEIIRNKNLNLAIIGPFKNKKFIDILKVSQ